MYVRPLVDADLNKLSANEQEALSNAIEKYASLSYDEIKEEEKHSLSRTMWPGARQPAILTVLIGIALPARPVWTARSWLPACAQPIKAKLESFMVDDMKY